METGAFWRGAKRMLLTPVLALSQFNSENPYQVSIQVTPVPEPAHFALMIAGLAATVGMHRRRARRQVA